jgi:probable phosphoglycerate mutase
MAVVLLIRHGETDFVKLGKMAGRTPGIHLNSKGLREARDLADCLREAPISAVYSSPMERTMETAKPLAKALGLKIRRAEGLIETDIGDWTGIEIKKARKMAEWKIVQSAPSRFHFPNGESFAEAQTRLVKTVEKIISSHSDRALIACFSHADPIRLVLAYYLGMPLDHFQRLPCSTGSVTVLRLTSQGSGLQGANFRPPFNFSFPK